jgi:signal peptidase I
MQKKDYLILVWEIFKTIFLIVLFVFLIRNFVIQPFYVVGSSMEPTYHNNDYLIINEIGYRIQDPKKGDVIVLKHPSAECNEYIKKSIINKITSANVCTNYLKRIAATPGDTIKIQDGTVYIKESGKEMFVSKSEHYIRPGTPTLGNITRQLGDNEYFVLGDNREPNASSDSREWGTITKKHIVGKVWFRLFPSFAVAN